MGSNISTQRIPEDVLLEIALFLENKDLLTFATLDRRTRKFFLANDCLRYRVALDCAGLVDTSSNHEPPLSSANLLQAITEHERAWADAAFLTEQTPRKLAIRSRRRATALFLDGLFVVPDTVAVPQGIFAIAYETRTLNVYDVQSAMHNASPLMEEGRVEPAPTEKARCPLFKA